VASGRRWKVTEDFLWALAFSVGFMDFGGAASFFLVDSTGRFRCMSGWNANDDKLFTLGAM